MTSWVPRDVSLEAATARSLDRLAARHPSLLRALIETDLDRPLPAGTHIPRATELLYGGEHRPTLERLSAQPASTPARRRRARWPRPPFTVEEWKVHSLQQLRLTFEQLRYANRPAAGRLRTSVCRGAQAKNEPSMVAWREEHGLAQTDDAAPSLQAEAATATHEHALFPPRDPPANLQLDPALYTGLGSDGKRHAARHANGTNYALCRALVTTGPYGRAARIGCHKCREQMR